MRKKYYSAFGFTIESDFDFDSLRTTKNNIPDIKIIRGQVPDVFQNVSSSGINELCSYSINELNEVVVNIFDVAKYFISKGNTVIIETCQSLDYDLLQVYLFGSIFSALFHQRGLFTLHGSAVSKNRKCLVFTGESRAGKSTFAQIFQSNGYNLVTDDVCLFEKNDHGLVLRPGIAELSLREDIVKNLRWRMNELSDKGYKKDKYVYPVNHFESNFNSVTDIFEIIPGNRFQITTLKGVDKAKSILRNTYRTENIIEFNLYNEHFKFFMELGHKVDFHQIERSSNQILGDEIVKAIESYLKKGL